MQTTVSFSKRVFAKMLSLTLIALCIGAGLYFSFTGKVYLGLAFGSTIPMIGLINGKLVAPAEKGSGFVKTHPLFIGLYTLLNSIIAFTVLQAIGVSSEGLVLCFAPMLPAFMYVTLMLSKIVSLCDETPIFSQGKH